MWDWSQDIASDYVSKWQDLAKSAEGDHTTLNVSAREATQLYVADL